VQSKLEKERQRLVESEGFAAGYRVPSTPVERDNGAACDICLGVGVVRAEGIPVDDPRFGKLYPCECQAQALAAQRQARLAELCNMNPQEMELTLDEFASRGKGSTTDEIVRRVRKFADCPTGFITLHGGPGNGKTLALMGLANHFRRLGKLSVYVPLVDLVEWIRAGYGPDADQSAEQRYNMVVQAYFLAIDETEKVKGTDWVEQLLARLLDRRYRDARERLTHTALALNASPFETFPEHIVSRLRDANFAVETDPVTSLGVPAIYYNGDADMRPAMPVPQEQLL
jgi:DNA replication protein DnaC